MDAGTGAVIAGVFSMLVALCTLMVKTLVDRGQQADNRFEGELERATAAFDEQLNRCYAETERVIKDRDAWQERALNCLDQQRG